MSKENKKEIAAIPNQAVGEGVLFSLYLFKDFLGGHVQRN